MQKQTLLGIDTGGTFTDFVLLDRSTMSWQVHKVLSTPEAPQLAILKGIEDLGLTSRVRNGEVDIVHGTTVATNAALEGKGARTAYITNRGMKDILIIGRQTRAELYSLAPTKPAVPVDPELTFEVSARVDATGNVISALDENELAALTAEIRQKDPEAIAINLLFSYLNSEHEIAIENMLTGNYFVSRSSDILPEYKEYERGATTWVNSWLGPRIENYLNALQADLAPAAIAIMQSSGLTIAAELAARKSVNLLLSGPAGGLSAAKYIADTMDRGRLLTFDMGGTSTDVALINGDIALTNSGRIANIPIGVPMADIHTIGAGGGSIAFIDAGGLLRVGPESAGADPGPACYGKGGKRPTVTDANLVLGYFDRNTQLADGLSLDFAAAEAAIATLSKQLQQSVKQTALGIIAIANEHMTQALRVISIQRGHDPRAFSLVCFGGAGGLHVCDLADALDMTEVIVPIHSGVLSALGMLTTQPGRELVQTTQHAIVDIDDAFVTEHLAVLAKKGTIELNSEGVNEIVRKDSLDLRYQGQTATLNLAYDGNLQNSVLAFHDAHKKQFGHQLDRGVELLNCRVHLEGTEVLPILPAFEETVQPSLSGGKILPRQSLPVGAVMQGPCLVVDDHATIRVTENWQFSLDQIGNLILTRSDTRL